MEKIRHKKGFSFIEVMLAVFLMSTGMVAAISLIGGGIRESIDSRSQLIASLLAQEGVELVRNIRDTNMIESPSPGAFDGISNGTWKIDIASPGLSSVGGSAVLNYDDSLNHRYAHSGGTPTKFSREIFISTTGVNERTVLSMVIWKGTFPLTVAGCTTIAGCSYAQTTLTAWGN
jgi:prepilin-type N-terminal cleavage/methylation domain-containing protein